MMASPPSLAGTVQEMVALSADDGEGTATTLVGASGAVTAGGGGGADGVGIGDGDTTGSGTGDGEGDGDGVGEGDALGVGGAGDTLGEGGAGGAKGSGTMPSCALSVVTFVPGKSVEKVWVTLVGLCSKLSVLLAAVAAALRSVVVLEVTANAV